MVANFLTRLECHFIFSQLRSTVDTLKLAEQLGSCKWFTSSLNGMKAVQPSGWLESLLNKHPMISLAGQLAKQFTEAYKQGNVASKTIYFCWLRVYLSVNS